MKNDNRVKRLESKGLIERLFIDYLRVARWFKHHFKTEVKKEKQIYFGKDTNLLWHDILGPYYLGPIKNGIEPISTPIINSTDTIILRDIEISTFVPRAPGLFYSTGYEIWKKGTDRRIFTKFLSTLTKKSPSNFRKN